MAPPLQAIGADTRIPAKRQTRRRHLRIADAIHGTSESAAAIWRRYVTANLERLATLIPSFHRSIPPSRDGRQVPLGARWRDGVELRDERTGKPYISNFIRSSRYTIWDFLPRQLVFQFMKIANFYFLIIAILQLIPGLSPVASYTTGAPLIVFVAFSMAKEGYDDYRRYKLDLVENRSSAWVLDPNGAVKARLERSKKGKIGMKRPSKRERTYAEAGRDFSDGTELRQIGEGDHANGSKHGEHTDHHSTARQEIWSHVQWQDIRVGDVVRLQRDEQVPADLVLLSASGTNGIAYIDTMALDGETNLKSKQACPLLAKRCGTVAGICHCDATVIAEDPNLDIYSFDGSVRVGDKTMPLTRDQVVFRGSTMRNTREAYGLVINSGEECKIRMNAHKSVRAKYPAMQAVTNRIVLLLIVVLVMLAVGLKIGNDEFEAEFGPTNWYMFGVRLTVSEQVFGFIILLNTLIPLSLYISLEAIKIGQLWMLQDVEMYDAESNTPIVANTTTIIENLGQVSYIFSDKTGTLTENVMRFQKLSLGGYVWNHDIGISDEAPETELQTQGLMQHLQYNPETPLSERALHFILCMALCNTCLPETTDRGDIEYQAASPDELALINAARELGYVMIDRDSETVKLQSPGSGSNEDGDLGTYNILDVIEFTSDRKRMSVILRTPEGRILLLSKGADSALLPRLRLKQLVERVAAAVNRRTNKRRSMRMESAKNKSGPASPGSTGEWSDFGLHDDHSSSEVAMLSDADIFEACFRHIEDFASEGLRTLLFGYRYLEEADYTAWKREYHEAETSLVDRQARIDSVAEKIELELELAGITAIEDKLQDGVPETIDKLRRANIKVWMLTGDKRETAINIGHSAKICQPFSDIFILDASAEGSHIDETMDGVLREVKEGAIEHSVVVIDGLTLTEVDKSKTSKDLFYDLLTRVDAVICCRASPAQKAVVVQCIRDRVPGSLTLAIGDGANDVAMIQASHVGIGISGKEGLQAARISDYSIAQFRFLQRLLLVHGRWNYVRTSKYILGTFWKEIVFYLNQALFARYNAYTGTSLFESASLTVFNALFTLLAVVLMGVFEQDLSAETLLAYPELYVLGQQDKGLNFVKYFGWMVLGAAEALVIFFTVFAAYSPTYSDDDTTIFPIGNAVFTAVVIFINIKMLLIEMHHKTWIVLGGFFITVTAWFVWNLFLALVYGRSIGPYTVRGSFIHGFGRVPKWWLAVLAALMAALMLELIVKSIRRVYFPSDTTIMQEMEAEQRRKETQVAKRHQAERAQEEGRS
ncbi:hypothetical protein PspLS_02512 [Pyricularia sp. CBS 133598]|nr:hypothetical protein PspLS_02512 [Pyricularia sp. CBS 133598]